MEFMESVFWKKIKFGRFPTMKLLVLLVKYFLQDIKNGKRNTLKIGMNFGMETQIHEYFICQKSGLHFWTTFVFFGRFREAHSHMTKNTILFPRMNTQKNNVFHPTCVNGASLSTIFGKSLKTKEKTLKRIKIKLRYIF